MYNKVIEEGSTLTVRCKRWIRGDEVVMHHLPSFTLCVLTLETFVTDQPGRLRDDHILQNDIVRISLIGVM
jgi:hypothetical protein